MATVQNKYKSPLDVDLCELTGTKPIQQERTGVKTYMIVAFLAAVALVSTSLSILNTVRLSNIEIELNNSLLAMKSEYTNTLESLNATFRQELDKTNGMTGPRGYNGSKGDKGDPGPPGAVTPIVCIPDAHNGTVCSPGVGNLTACTHRKYYGGSGYSTVSQTQWIPQLANSEDIRTAKESVITGVTCTTLGGVETYLETRTDTPTGIEQYKCKCGGRSTEIVNPSRLCYIHVWSCPSTS